MMTEMKMLLWKDFQLSRLCLLASIIFLISPYLFFFYPYIEWHFEGAWLFSAAISQITMALLAGNIIACERADRSAAFLDYQGASRKMVVASKLIICTITFVSICAISFILSFWLKIKSEEVGDFRVAQICMIAIGFCFFGFCWLLSAMLMSAVVSIVLGLLPPIILGIAFSVTIRFFHWPDECAFPYWYIAFVTATGLISLVAGTWCFLRRKES
jgi:hypothetical protein